MTVTEKKFIMNKKGIRILLFLFFSGLFPVGAAEFKVDPAQSCIVLPKGSSKAAVTAANELQKILGMITGTKITCSPQAVPGKFPFVFLKADRSKLKPEECGYQVTEKGVSFYGNDDPVMKNTASLSAVCDFLERQLQVRFMEPGDEGIFYVPAAQLKLKNEKRSWDPGRLVVRGIRHDFVSWQYKGRKLNGPNMPPQLKYPIDEYSRRGRENDLWMKYHRMGYSVRFTFSHAFTDWWRRYGRTNPEYFALYKGKRAPVRANLADRIKMCVSNPGLRDRIVENWKNQKKRSRFINICENDSRGFCTCPECRKLDVTPPGKKWDDFLSDRYFNFANGVLARARKIDPDVKVCIYAYDVYTDAPLRERIDNGVVIGVVPTMTHPEKTANTYKRWRERGADWILQRPNDPHVNTGLPMGFEKQMWQGFQVGVKNGIVGTDYDSSHGFWAATGIAEYILARAHSYPQAAFEELLDHYCQGYGSMAPEIKAYYNYWRLNIWDKRIYPDRERIAKLGRWGHLRRGVLYAIKDIYTAKDWEITGRLLEKAAAKAKTPVEKKRIAYLQLNHRHFVLTWRAVAAADPLEKMRLGRELLDFRVKYGKKLNCNLMRQTTIELDAKDITAVGRAAKWGIYNDVRELKSYWKFDVDPDDAGEKEAWQKMPFKMIDARWNWIYSNVPWGKQTHKDVHPVMAKFLKSYRGSGWYHAGILIPAQWKKRPCALLFNAPAPGTKVFLNGKECPLVKNSASLGTAALLTDNIDWNKKAQSLVIKVKGTPEGGLLDPVLLAVK